MDHELPRPLQDTLLWAGSYLFPSHFPYFIPTPGSAASTLTVEKSSPLTANMGLHHSTCQLPIVSNQSQGAGLKTSIYLDFPITWFKIFQKLISFAFFPHSIFTML